MRTEANRDELSKFFDIEAIDNLCDTVANMAMKNLSINLIPIIMTMDVKATEKEIDAVINGGLEKQFRDMMGYCFNKIINYINTNGEKGIEFSNFVHKTQGK